MMAPMVPTYTARRLIGKLRLLLLPLALGTTFVAADTSPAKAEIDYPYCLRVYTSRDFYNDCSYSTMAQCRMSASGRTAECYRDPFYAGPPGSAYVVRKPRFVPDLSDGPDSPYYVPPQPRSKKQHHRTKRRQHKN
jgi:hypothetical protein